MSIERRRRKCFEKKDKKEFAAGRRPGDPTIHRSNKQSTSPVQSSNPITTYYDIYVSSTSAAAEIMIQTTTTTIHSGITAVDDDATLTDNNKSQ